MKTKIEQTGIQKIISIIKKSKTVDEAYANVIYPPIPVSDEDSQSFSDEYNPNNNRTMKQSFELFYNDVKNNKVAYYMDKIDFNDLSRTIN